MATKKIRRFSEGGDTDKAAGLEASKGEKVGFFERLMMGNIDQPGSEAFKRFGAGRGKMERTPVEDAVAVPATRAQAPEMDELEAANAREPIAVPAGPRATSSTGGGRASSEKKASPKMQEQTYTRRGGATAKEREEYQPPVSGGIYSNEGRGKELTKAQKFDRAVEVKRPSREEIQTGLESAALPGMGLRGLQGLAKKLATPKTAAYSQEALAAPTKRLTYDKAGAVAKTRAERAAAREKEMLEENAARYGLDPKAPGYEAASGAIRKELGGKDFSFKRGGAVKKTAKPMNTAKKMSSGGSTTQASRRGDGIALRGKTRGGIY